VENNNSPELIEQQMQDTRNALTEKVALLEDHGYVRAQTVHRTGGRGRPPSPRYLVHPRLTNPTA
jgi:hypothetical protein